MNAKEHLDQAEHWLNVAENSYADSTRDLGVAVHSALGVAAEHRKQADLRTRCGDTSLLVTVEVVGP